MRYLNKYEAVNMLAYSNLMSMYVCMYVRVVSVLPTQDLPLILGHNGPEYSGLTMVTPR